jgi:hypothetical protein
VTAAAALRYYRCLHDGPWPHEKATTMLDKIIAMPKRGRANG